MDINTVEYEFWIVIKVILAAFLTAFVGYEREKFKKPAGVKTNMIMGSISCYFVANSTHLIDWVSQNEEKVALSTDPLRLIQAIVIGVSFIGAGTILKSERKNTVLYLTTAATLLYSAGIGISVAIQQYVISIGLTLLIITVNWIVNKLEKKME